MARPRTPDVEITEAVQPQATIHDTYVRPAAAPKSPMWEVAAALKDLNPRIGAAFEGMEKQQAEADALQGEADFWTKNQEGAAEATATYERTEGAAGIPPFASPHYMRGMQKAQGTAQGLSMDGAIGQAYVAWPGKTSDDPAAFDKWFEGTIRPSLEGKPPGVLRGLLPSVRELHSKYSQKWIADRSQDLTYRMNEATAAGAGGFIDEYVKAGLGREGGTDVTALGASLQQVRDNAIKSGAERSKIDQTIVNAVTAKAQFYRDPNLLNALDQIRDSSTGIPLSEGEYGRKEKLQATASIDTAKRQEEERRYTVEQRKQKADHDVALKAATKALVDAKGNLPLEKLHPDVIRSIEKHDPNFRKDWFEYQKTVMDGQVQEDQTVLSQLSMDILRGGGTEALWRAIRSGDVKDPGTITKMVALIDTAEKGAASGARILEHPSFKRILTNIQTKTADPTWKGSINQEPGLNAAGRAATYDATFAAMEWVAANPTASAMEREKFLQELGERLFKGLDASGETTTYTQPPGTGRQDNPALPAEKPGEPRTTGGAARPAEGPLNQLRTAPQPPKLREMQLTPEQRSDVEARAKRLGVDPQLLIDRAYQNIQTRKQRGAIPGGPQQAPNGQAPSGNPVSPTPEAAPGETQPAPGPHGSLPGPTLASLSQIGDVLAEGLDEESVSRVQDLVRNASAASLLTPDESLGHIKGDTDMAPQGSPQPAKSTLQLAEQFIGTNEQDDRAALASFFEKAGVNPLDPAKTPWCMRFVNGIFQATGHQGTGSDMARSALKYGLPVSSARVEPGDIGVWPRGKAPFGHVAIIKKVDHKNKRVLVIGGNQGGAAQKGGGVTETWFPLSKALGFRRVNEQVASNIMDTGGTALA